MKIASIAPKARRITMPGGTCLSMCSSVIMSSTASSLTLGMRERLVAASRERRAAREPGRATHVGASLQSFAPQAARQRVLVVANMWPTWWAEYICIFRKAKARTGGLFSLTFILADRCVQARAD